MGFAGSSVSGEYEDPLLCGLGDEAAQTSSSWCVYLLALSDCSAFKVGFSCNPLLRIYTFSRRYFERFDLSQSTLLRLNSCDDARAVEAALKTEFAARREACPPWVPEEAGGHTEWFSAVYFDDAERRLRSVAQNDPAARLMSASDFIRSELVRLTAAFERWACAQAEQAVETWSFASRGYTTADASRSLRDWLDAYRFFDIPLLADDPAALDFVSRAARLPLER